MSLLEKVQKLTAENLHRIFPTLPQKLDLRRHFKLIAPGMAQVEERIREQVAEFDPAMHGYVAHAVESQGKRIRPALTLLTAHATGGISSGHVDLAVVIELIHLATLVHDDIMDNATKRRGAATSNARWGADTAVLLGDSLFAQALMLCTRFDTMEISRRVAAATKEVCCGEILQTQRRFDLQMKLPEYLRIIQMKTAPFFYVATELAAYLNGLPPEQVARCRHYGDCLGIAYQIYDDCLDLVGTEDAAGKTVGTDLERGKLTLPILHLLHHAADTERAAISETIVHGTEDDRVGLLALAVERGGLRESVAHIRRYLAEAQAALDFLPQTDHRRALEAIAGALAEHVGRLDR